MLFTFGVATELITLALMMLQIVIPLTVEMKGERFVVNTINMVVMGALGVPFDCHSKITPCY